MRSLRNLDGLEATVGIHEGESEGGTLSTAAAANEFGRDDGSIPERPALRSAFDANQAKYDRLLEQAARLVQGGATPKAALARGGLEIRNDFIRSIQAWSAPPNDPATIAKKGSSNPLVDTGATQRAITVKVGRGGQR